MNSQEYRNLSEAYLDVYQEIDERVLGQDPEMRRARTKDEKRLPPSSGKEYATNQKKSISYMDKLTKNNRIIPGMTHEEVEEFDEGIGSAIKSLFGKKKEPEAQKPLSRGAELRQKYNTGPDKSDTSAKRKILDKTRERAERDEKEYGDSPYTKSVATKSREAHNKYLRAGYNKYGADRSDSGGMGGSGGSGRGSKAAKRAAALNNSYDLFDYMMEYLMIEGYADTNENALVIMANMSEEWLGNIMEKKYEPDEELPGSGLTPSRKYRIKRKEFLKHSKDSYQGPYAGLATKSGVRIHPDDPKETGRTRAHRMTSNYNSSKNESYDLYDVILAHLLAEGYADTNENALVIMANMSEEWRESIIG